MMLFLLGLSTSDENMAKWGGAGTMVKRMSGMKRLVASGLPVANAALSSTARMNARISVGYQVPGRAKN
jgi:hypothetical protein